MPYPCQRPVLKIPNTSELHYVVIIMPCVKNCPFTWLTPSRLGVWGKSCCSSLVLGIFSTGYTDKWKTRRGKAKM